MLEKFMDIIAPHECLDCGREGWLLCPTCRSNLRPAAERCYGCQALSRGGRTCRTCRRQRQLYSVHTAVSYEGAAKELVGRLKFGGARRAAADMASIMKSLVPDDDCLLVPVPTASLRVRQRGYDQTELIAKQLSKITGRVSVTGLARVGQQRQVGATRRQRLKQLSGGFRVMNYYLVADKIVVLVDDVITTGATLEMSAIALKQAGAKRVIGLTFARA